MATWEATRRHARALETALEAKLTHYSKIAAGIAASSGSGSGAGGRRSQDALSEAEEGVGGYKLVEEEVEELLDKVRRVQHWSDTRSTLTHSLSSPQPRSSPKQSTPSSPCSTRHPHFPRPR